MALLGLGGALVLCAFLVMPQGQAFAAAILTLFRGQTVQAIPTSYNQLEAAYKALEQLEQLGTLQGSVPTRLNTVSSVAL
jgi:hypothetical protein